MSLNLNCINKRGSVLDTVGIILGLVVLVVSMFLGNAFYNEVKATGTLQENNVTAPIFEAADFYFNYTADNLILALWVGLVIAAVISSILSRANALFLYISILVSLVLIPVAALISNWYEEFSAADSFAGFVHLYPKTNYIFAHLPLLTLVSIFIIIICLFAVNRGGGSREF